MVVVLIFQVFEDCLQNSSLAGFLENHHSSHDCEANQLKMLLHQPVNRVSNLRAPPTIINRVNI